MVRMLYFPYTGGGLRIGALGRRAKRRWSLKRAPRKPVGSETSSPGTRQPIPGGSSLRESLHTRRFAHPSLGLVIAATALVLSLGYLQKLPCFTGPLQTRQFHWMCFTDIVAVNERGVGGPGKVPYLESQFEYPVLTGGVVYLAARFGSSRFSFFTWTSVLLGGLGVVTAWALHQLVGGRALMFAFAPTLLAYAFFNWDLLAVALAVLATTLYVRDRMAISGALLGLGTAAKLFPGLLLIPFTLGLWSCPKRKEASVLVGSAAAAWLAVNLPVSIISPRGWAYAFRYQSSRGTDIYTLWALPERLLHFLWPAGLLNLLWLGAFLVVGVVAWRWARSRRPGFPAWTFGFPLIAAFLLTSKAYSPVYSLWLLPWFAIALPDWRAFVAFEAADMAVFVTVFQWSGGHLPFLALELSVVARALVLLTCLILWIRSRGPRGEEGEGAATMGSRPSPGRDDGRHAVETSQE